MGRDDARVAEPLWRDWCPLVVGDLVISGVAGGDEGIRGFIAAYKATTGKLAWRFWTVPKRGEPGSETWSGKAIEVGARPHGSPDHMIPSRRIALLADGQSISRHRR